MFDDNKIWVGSSDFPVYLNPKMANRHGLIAGATGTGKTVTLKVMAEAFSDMGVPVFVSDVKGDLAGMAKPGEHSQFIQKRLEDCNVSNFSYKPFPTIFWDIYGKMGHPIRATVSEMGPMLLGRMLRLNEIQSGVLNILFRIADDEGMLLIDLKDMKAMLAYVGENSRKYTLNYGNVSSASVGAIQRAIGLLEDQGGDVFFGEPAFNIADWLQVDSNGNGAINILHAAELFQQPLMYSTFLLWLLSELYETLPEQGDSDKPKIVFFFDEAHLLFSDCPDELMDKIEMVIRLIRSKGVGVYFVTQNPADIPASVLGQLGNRVQHALRAYTPADQRGLKLAADTFRANPNFDTAEVITQLKTGEALISFLNERGAPSVVERCLVLPPQSFIGTIDDELRNTILESSPFAGVYDEQIDRDSAYERLSALFAGQASVPQITQKTIPTVQTYAQSIPTFNSVAPAGTRPAAQPQYAQQAQAPVQPVAAQAQPAAKQPVYLVFDPATGQYVPAKVQPSNMPAVTPQQQVVNQEEEQKTLKDAEEKRKEAEKAAKEEAKRIAAEQKAIAKEAKELAAAERRARMDELREERADRARKNSSVMGRMVNSAVSSAGRQLGSSVTRGVLGIFTGLGKK